MNYMEINKKIDELSKTGKYNNSQLEAIRYACFIPNFDIESIMDPSIPNDIMLSYIKLVTTHKIDICKYINNKWHLKGFNGDQLYYLIFYDNQGYDVSNITPDMSVDEIKAFFNNHSMEIEKNRLLDSNILDHNYRQMLEKYNLDLPVLKFFMRKIEAGYDISIFLRPGINQFSFEQIKYLFAIYSTGSDIESIFNPSLSVKQMKEKILSSNDSTQFMQQIMENHDSRGKSK